MQLACEAHMQSKLHRQAALGTDDSSCALAMIKHLTSWASCIQAPTVYYMGQPPLWQHALQYI
jgi:hypothetical protein